MSSRLPSERMAMKTKEASSILWKVVALVLLISSRSFSLHWVCVDPGHGGIHSGTVGRVYGVLEKDVNFGVGHRAWTYLGLANYNAIMTRYADVTRYPAERADTANKAKDGFGVDVFFSIHHNATLDMTYTLTNGTE